MIQIFHGKQANGNESNQEAMIIQEAYNYLRLLGYYLTG